MRKSKYADEFLRLKAEIAEKNEELARVKKCLERLGPRSVEGELGRVVIVKVDDAFVVDFKAAATSALKEAVLSKYKKVKRGGYKFTGYARTGEG